MLQCHSFTPQAVSSDHPTLKNLVEQFSEYIAQVKPSLEGFFDDFANLLQEFKCAPIILSLAPLCSCILPLAFPLSADLAHLARDAWESGSIEEIVEALKEIVANERGEEIEWKRGAL